VVARKPRKSPGSDGPSHVSSDSRRQAEEVLDLLRSQGDSSWREGLADRHATSDMKRNADSAHHNAYANDESRLISYFRQIQKLVHKCRTPGCGQKFETQERLAEHERAAHSSWPHSSQTVADVLVENETDLTNAIADIEREFTAMLNVLVPGLSDGVANSVSLNRRLNEMQDSYASRGLPTASSLTAGAVQYARLLIDEVRGADSHRFSSQLRNCITTLQRAKGLGGNLGLALRSLRFRSALLNQEEFQDLAESAPDDVFRRAIRARLGENDVPVDRNDIPDILGEPMKVIILGVSSSQAGPSILAQLSAISKADWVAVPWVKALTNPIEEEPS
jgi:hypothetical protein